MKTTRRRTHRRLALCAAFACCLALTHPARGSRLGQDITVRFPSGGGGGEADTLSQEGPQFAALYYLSDITARVFVRGGAPMVVEYQLGPESTAALTLKATVKKDEKSFTHRLEPTGGEIRQVVFTLPEEFGDKPAVAALSIRAENTSGDAAQPPDFELLGLGMGEKAVGSMTIERLSFEPGRVRATQRERAAYGFYSRFDFPRARAEFRLLGRTPAGAPFSRLAGRQELGGLRRGESVRREWDGRNHKGAVSAGRHQFVVRAWYTEKKGGDWTAACSRQRVLIE